MADKLAIKKWMKNNVHFYTDLVTDQVNVTYLAEAAAYHFSESSVDTPTVYYDAAQEVGRKKEKMK